MIGGLGSGPSSGIHNALLRARSSSEDTSYQEFRVLIGDLGSGSSNEIHSAIFAKELGFVGWGIAPEEFRTPL